MFKKKSKVMVIRWKCRTCSIVISDMSARLLNVSPALQKILSASQATRPSILRGAWKYIKDNKLQSDATNKRLVVADEAMRGVIGGASEFDSRSLLKLLQPHITDPEKETRDKVKAARTSALASVSTARDAYLAAKSAAATAPFKLSAPLAVIVGKGEASRTDIIKALWAYVKTNKLQLEDKKNVIRVDEPLRKVLKVSASDATAPTTILFSAVTPNISSPEREAVQVLQDKLKALRASTKSAAKLA